MVLLPPVPSTFLDSSSASNPFDNPGHLFTLYRDTMYQNHKNLTGPIDTSDSLFGAISKFGTRKVEHKK